MNAKKEDLVSHYQPLIYDMKAMGRRNPLTLKENLQLGRMESLLYALSIGCDCFFYLGGIYETTCKFCRNRNSKVFTVDELIGWSDAPDRPRVSGWDVVRDLGGDACDLDMDGAFVVEPGERFCRHRLRFIFPSLAEQFRPDLKKAEGKKESLGDILGLTDIMKGYEK